MILTYYLRRHYSFSQRYLDSILPVIFNDSVEGELIFQLVTSHFTNWREGICVEGIDSGKELASEINCSSGKHKELPFGRIFRRWLSHEREEQAPWAVGADQLAVLGTRGENSTNVTSLKAGIFEELSDTACDKTHTPHVIVDFGRHLPLDNSIKSTLPRLLPVNYAWTWTSDQSMLFS